MAQEKLFLKAESHGYHGYYGVREEDQPPYANPFWKKVAIVVFVVALGVSFYSTFQNKPRSNQFFASRVVNPGMSHIVADTGRQELAKLYATQWVPPGKDKGLWSRPVYPLNEP